MISPKTDSPWFTDVRKVALATFVTTTLGLPIPVWNSIRSLFGTATANPWMRGWIVLGGFVAALFTSIMPTFYFALYRNTGALYLSRPSRVLSLWAAMIYGAIAVTDLPDLVESLRALWHRVGGLDFSVGTASVAQAAGDLTILQELSTAMSALSAVAFIMLLIAFSREAGDDPPGAPLSRSLQLISKIATMVWGCWLAFNVVVMVAVPYNHAELQNEALAVGRSAPPLWRMFARGVHNFLDQACLFVAPFVVYKGRHNRPTTDRRSGSYCNGKSS